MRILFLTDYWFPNMTANTICVRNISEELLKQHNQVYVCAYDGKNAKDEQDGIRFSFVKPSLARRLLRAAQNAKNNSEAHILSTLGKLMNRTRRAFLLPFYPITSFSVPFRWRAKANDIIREHGIDTVVSVVAPEESLYAGYLIKKSNPSINWIVYYIDAGTNILPGTSFEQAKKGLQNKAVRWENRILKEAEKIVVMEGHYPYYLKTLNDTNRRRLYSANVPLLRIKRENACLSYRNNNDVQKWVYTGSINGIFYDPKPLCEFFSTYCQDHDAELHLYGPSDHKEYLMKAQKKCSRIVWHGPVSHEDALNAQEEADVLVYFKCGRLDSVSGKLFEYLVMRKPVVYMGLNDDINAKQLEKYKRGLILNSNDPIPKQVSKADEFFAYDGATGIVTIEEIEAAYYSSLPSTTARLFLTNN